jgi:pilus assembly protein CpaB
VLVAREGIGVGQRLTVASLGWEDWPEGAVRPEYITIDAAPEAIEDMSGSLARVEIFPGEPIYRKKLVPPGQGGHLSAVLDRGKRGVSVSVAAASASGGFIVPGDRVDVVLTRASQTGSQYSETVLSNVRVLAINTRLGADVQSEGPADIEVFTNSAIATLELDPTQAKVIMTATTMGGLSLVLRPMTDSAETDLIEHRPANQAIRISSPFWAK